MAEHSKVVEQLINYDQTLDRQSLEELDVKVKKLRELKDEQQVINTLLELNQFEDPRILGLTLSLNGFDIDDYIEIVKLITSNRHKAPHLLESIKTATTNNFLGLCKVSVEPLKVILNNERNSIDQDILNGYLASSSPWAKVRHINNGKGEYVICKIPPALARLLQGLDKALRSANENRIDTLREDLESIKSILEQGPGNGIWSPALHKSGDSLQKVYEQCYRRLVTAIENSFELLYDYAADHNFALIN